jgi:pimeloyl-ACP methyl ester carboxylesterase
MPGIEGVNMIHRRPKKPNGTPPILFIHGAFAGAWCWDEFFLPWFADEGFDVYAIDLPGRRGRPDYAELQNFTLSDYQDAVYTAIDQFDEPPIVVGHSMGGFLAWRACEVKNLAALVLMAPVPPTGLAAPAMQLMMTNPSLAMDVAAIHAGGAAQEDTLHATLFSDAVPREVAERYITRFQSESSLAVSGLYAPRMPNVMGFWGTPILVLGAGSDPLIPPAHVHWTGSICGKNAHIYQGMGHGMMLEIGWQRVAEDIAIWIKDQGLVSVSKA